MRAVKPVLPVMIIAAVFLTGCGFQLNRNRVTLPDNARSISLQNIENKSYTAGLDLLLKEQLIDRFSRNAVNIKAVQTADLSLQFQITNSRYSRSDYALDSSVKTYVFVFTISGRLSVVNNIKNSTLFKNQSLSGTYSLKTESTDLTQTEISDGRLEALGNLAEKIVTKISQDF